MTRLPQNTNHDAHKSETKGDLVVGAQDADEELVAMTVVDVCIVLKLKIVQVASVTERNIERKQHTKTNDDQAAAKHEPRCAQK